MHVQRPRLLIVDDDRSLVTLIGTIAIEDGVAVGGLLDGTDALVRVREAGRLVLRTCGCQPLRVRVHPRSLRSMKVFTPATAPGRHA